ncbi:ABC transporter permease [Nocardia nova]|uniref:ABC transporter permease n=1 Tax=Nocardia nova TaxID=37330 RepID=A0A2S6AGG5_9NOCA|nr:ABC transporter permease [Nocardia nova]PPJ20017.1 ABC transporter permease [Nocardia nova]PPJ33847.1 ABC transporter permease [Nocardia nova]
MGVVTAERIKLTSTRSPWWCSAIVVALGLGMAALFAAVSRASMGHENETTLTTAGATVGVSGFGVMVLMIMAALTVTSEYRFGIIRTTFQATPNRSLVLTTKALLTGAYAAVLTFVLGLLAYLIAKPLAGDAGRQMSLSSDADWRALYGLAIYAFLAVVLSVGIGALVRQSAAAISLIVLWPLLIETLLGSFGSFGRTVQPFLPFANINRFLGEDTSSAAHWHWGPWGGLVYFIVFVAVVFGAALIVVDRRDA